MKQRVVVQAVIYNSKKEVLVLRRSNGSPSIIGQYELPGGTLLDNEQLESSLTRHILNDAGIHLDKFILKDAITMKDREDSDIQHVFIVYATTMPSDVAGIKASGSYDEVKWINPKSMPDIALRDSAMVILNTQNHYEDISTTSEESKYILYSDGGSRGNPGPSAAGFVLIDAENEQVIEEDGIYLGITTNNQAEYSGLRIGLERAIERGILSLECRIDSQLVVNQLNGSYHIKNNDLWPVYERIKSYIPHFQRISFVHVPREYNQKADAVVNLILNQHQNDTA